MGKHYIAYRLLKHVESRQTYYPQSLWFFSRPIATITTFSHTATCLLLCSLSDISAYSPFGTLYYDSTSKDTGINRLRLLRVMHTIYITFFIGLSPNYNNDNLLSRTLLTLTIILSTCQHSHSLGQTMTTASHNLPSIKTRLNSRQLALMLMEYCCSTTRSYTTQNHTTIAQQITSNVIKPSQGQRLNHSVFSCLLLMLHLGVANCSQSLSQRSEAAKPIAKLWDYVKYYNGK